MKSSYGNEVRDDVGREQIVEAEQLRRLYFILQVESHWNARMKGMLGKD